MPFSTAGIQATPLAVEPAFIGLIELATELIELAERGQQRNQHETSSDLLGS
jgi:hypothetical protein